MWNTCWATPNSCGSFTRSALVLSRCFGWGSPAWVLGWGLRSQVNRAWTRWCCVTPCNCASSAKLEPMGLLRGRRSPYRRGLPALDLTLFNRRSSRVACVQASAGGGRSMKWTVAIVGRSTWFAVQPFYLQTRCRGWRCGASYRPINGELVAESWRHGTKPAVHISSGEAGLLSV
jgi:hypothetical protein